MSIQPPEDCNCYQWGCDQKAGKFHRRQSRDKTYSVVVLLFAEMQKEQRPVCGKRKKKKIECKIVRAIPDRPKRNTGGGKSGRRCGADHACPFFRCGRYALTVGEALRVNPAPYQPYMKRIHQIDYACSTQSTKQAQPHGERGSGDESGNS